jgi:hypothetical protein
MSDFVGHPGSHQDPIRGATLKMAILTPELEALKRDLTVRTILEVVKAHQTATLLIQLDSAPANIKRGCDSNVKKDLRPFHY